MNRPTSSAGILLLFLMLCIGKICINHDIIVNARIVPNDEDLTVFPDSCVIPTTSESARSRWTKMFSSSSSLPYSYSTKSYSKNCGIHRLDGLHHSWILRSEDGVYQNIPALVPGDILTDLQDNGLIDDPLSDMNFLDQRRVWMGDEEVFSSRDEDGKLSSCSFEQDKDSFAFTDERNKPFHHEYHIPNLEKRTRTWIYETNFTLQHDDSMYGHGHGHGYRRPHPLRERMSSNSYPRRNTGLDASSERTESRYAIVVEGIKMGASILVNGVMVGNMNITDQFLRYIIPIPSSILRRPRDEIESDLFTYSQQNYQNSLSVIFDPEIDTRGRFMACSGGWDWAPYSNAAEASCSSRRVFSFGIFKPIYLIQVHEVAIVHIVPKIQYLGDPSIRGLRNSNRGNGGEGVFQMDVDVHLQYFGDDLGAFLAAGGGEIILRAPFLEDEVIVTMNDELAVSRRPPIIIVTITEHVRTEDVNLWWPNGVGNANLYTIEIAYRNVAKKVMTSFVRRQIGFRTVELISHKDQELRSDSDEQGTGSHGMFFRVNGVELWTRGANVVPMSQLEGRLTDIAHETLVSSASATNMNMLRVWGGGMVMPDSFYNACDQNGILIYHDLMFVEEQYHSLERRQVVGDEIRHIVKSLSSHPSIVLWNGCNECERGNVTNDAYSDFALKIVGTEDPTRIIWPSSPSSGWGSGVTKTGMPSGSELIYKNKTIGEDIETHGPYNHGWSWTFDSVNGHDRGDKYDIKIPIEVNQSILVGFNHPNYFVSEFGASVHSSFESMSSTLKNEAWGLHGDQLGTSSNCTVVFENCNECTGNNVMAQRNYPCDSHIEAYFGKGFSGEVGKEVFQEQLYKCMVSQMLWMKGTIEMLRNRNSFGSLIWQLNENWPTGGWGLVEYGSQEDDRGQVVGGRWKPLMYLLKRSLFRNVFATCGKDGKCFVRNDCEDTFEGMIQVNYWNVSGSETILHKKVKMYPKSIEYFAVDVDDIIADSYALELIVLDTNEVEVMGQNIALMVPPKGLTFLSVDATINIESAHIRDGGIDMILTTDKTVLYVVLTTIAQGRFSDNAFSMTLLTRKTVRFIPYYRLEPSFDINSFLASLRIEHLGMWTQ